MAEDQIAPGKIVIIGGSAGGLEVILGILSALDTKMAITIIIVLHRKFSYDSPLAELLGDRIEWPTREVEEKDPILSQRVYLAPGDYHLLVENDHSFSLDVSEKINYSRPSIDISFESAAEVYGTDLTAILLSGANSDGVEGLKKVKQYGGTCIVQDPATAEVSYMPQQALNEAPVDFIVNGDDMAVFLNKQFAGFRTEKPNGGKSLT